MSYQDIVRPAVFTVRPDLIPSVDLRVLTGGNLSTGEDAMQQRVVRFADLLLAVAVEAADIRHLPLGSVDAALSSGNLAVGALLTEDHSDATKYVKAVNYAELRPKPGDWYINLIASEDNLTLTYTHDTIRSNVAFKKDGASYDLRAASYQGRDHGIFTTKTHGYEANGPIPIDELTDYNWRDVTEPFRLLGVAATHVTRLLSEPMQANALFGVDYARLDS